MHDNVKYSNPHNWFLEDLTLQKLEISYPKANIVSARRNENFENRCSQVNSGNGRGSVEYHVYGSSG